MSTLKKTKPTASRPKSQGTTPELLAAARQRLLAWQPTANSQISVLRDLADAIDAMFARGAKPADLRAELQACGIYLQPQAYRQFRAERPEKAQESGAAK